MRIRKTDRERKKAENKAAGKNTYLDTAIWWGIVLSEELRYNFSYSKKSIKRSAAYLVGCAVAFRREHGHIWERSTVRICWN